MSSDVDRAADPSRRFPRALLIAIALILVFSSAVLLAGRFRSGTERERPNFVVVVTDDQRWDTLDGMPAVQRLLVDHGVMFTNAFVTTPSCCPSRVSLLTGQYSHHTGVFDGSAGNAPGGAPAFADDSSLAVWLHDEGYRTGLFGKYLNDYAELPMGYIPPGWDQWYAIAQPSPQIRYYDYELNENGTIVRYGDAPSDYSTAVLQEKAIRFLEDDEDDAPFLLYFAPIAPHSPSIPAPQDTRASVVPGAERTPSFDEADVTDKPGGGPPPLTPGAMERAGSMRVEMLRSLLGVDRAVEAIVEAVEATGRIENTYFLLTSDNGFLLGEHRLLGKVWPYEESIRVPLVIRTPDLDVARSVEQLALNLDIVPTIAELAGIETGLRQDGRSLAPLLRDESVAWRDRFLVEFLGYAPQVPPYVAIRTVRYVYVEYRNGWRELYDLRDDPLQLRNLARAPAGGAIARDLRAALRQMTAR